MDFNTSDKITFLFKVLVLFGILAMSYVRNHHDNPSKESYRQKITHSVNKNTKNFTGYDSDLQIVMANNFNNKK